jgi:hypothetical protein
VDWGPSPAPEPEPGYTPSKALADYVRYRDLTCRFPNCDQPALACDVDHTVPHGDDDHTHPSNLKCQCRFHHVLKPLRHARRREGYSLAAANHRPGNVAVNASAPVQQCA